MVKTKVSNLLDQLAINMETEHQNLCHFFTSLQLLC